MQQYHRKLNIKREQFRQAREIHGGWIKLLAAVMAIKLARMPIPGRKLRLSVYRGAFAKRYPPGLDEREAELPIWAYPSLNALFTRGIKPQCRPIPAAEPQFLQRLRPAALFEELLGALHLPLGIIPIVHGDQEI